MPDIKQELPDRKKIKKKMSKAQMQLAIIKKKQCDAKALIIVEQLLEPNVDAQWLLQNLGYINKSHMEDVIEERAIIKLCGYVLCKKSLTIRITQQYHISTKHNKVYDVSRRKNFCSSRCYGACCYLLEQMLTSPLWLRDKEEIPVFQLLPAEDQLHKSMPGEEVHVGGSDIALDVDNDEARKKSSMLPEVEEKSFSDDRSQYYLNERSDLKKNKEIIDGCDTQSENVSINSESVQVLQRENESDTSKRAFELENTQTSVEETSTLEISTEQDNTKVQNVCTLVNNDFSKGNVSESKTEADTRQTSVNDEQLDHVYLSESNTENIEDLDYEPVTEHNVSKMQKVESHEQIKHKKDKRKESIKSEKRTNGFYALVMHIEQSIKEWITEETLCLLSGEENTRNRLLENVVQHDKYLQLCKKLNKLQLEDEKDDRSDLEKTTLKPLPHFSVLQEEGKKMELKVRAFYQGKAVIEQSDDTAQNMDDDESAPVLPLTDVYAPKALRRRIFLDKLHRILPDLLRALTSNKQSYLNTQYIYSEKSALIKALVNTFSLSATNIIFKTAEWTLVGLIIIKMLSIIDPQLKVLLTTKQASMYTSMILMSYKLDCNYLDRLVMEITNNTEIFNSIPSTVS